MFANMMMPLMMPQQGASSMYGQMPNLMQFNPFMMQGMPQMGGANPFMNPMMMPNFMQGMPQLPQMQDMSGMQRAVEPAEAGKPADASFVQQMDDVHMGLPAELIPLEEKATEPKRPADEQNVQTDSEYLMNPYGMMNPMQA